MYLMPHVVSFLVDIFMKLTTNSPIKKRRSHTKLEEVERSPLQKSFKKVDVLPYGVAHAEYPKNKTSKNAHKTLYFEVL